jgi:hypothetical protein
MSEQKSSKRVSWSQLNSFSRVLRPTYSILSLVPFTMLVYSNFHVLCMISYRDALYLTTETGSTSKREHYSTARVPAGSIYRPPRDADSSESCR